MSKSGWPSTGDGDTIIRYDHPFLGSAIHARGARTSAAAHTFNDSPSHNLTSATSSSSLSPDLGFLATPTSTRSGYAQGGGAGGVAPRRRASRGRPAAVRALQFGRRRVLVERSLPSRSRPIQEPARLPGNFCTTRQNKGAIAVARTRERGESTS